MRVFAWLPDTHTRIYMQICVWRHLESANAVVKAVLGIYLAR